MKPQPIAARRQRKAPAKPIAGLMDGRFVYVPASKTDVRLTFARIRAERAKGGVL